MGHIGWRGVLWVVAASAAVTAVAAIAFVPESLSPERRCAGGIAATFRAIPVLVANRRFVVFLLLGCFASAVMFAYISASPFVMQSMLGLSAVQYAFAFAANAIGMGVMSFVAIRTVRRWAPLTQLRGGTLLLAAAALALLVLAMTGAFASTRWMPLTVIWLAIASLGLITGNSMALASDAGRAAAGAASALLGSLQFLVGAAVSPLVGIAGEDTAFPLAIVMVFGAGLLVALSRSRHASTAPM